MNAPAAPFCSRWRRALLAAPVLGLAALGALLVADASGLPLPGPASPSPGASPARAHLVHGSPLALRAHRLPLRAEPASTLPATSRFRNVIEPTETSILEVLLADTSRSLDERIQTATRELGRQPTPAEMMRHLPKDEPAPVTIAAVDNEDLLSSAWNSALNQFERESAHEVLEERLLSPAPESIRNIRVSLDLVLLDPRPAVFLAFDCAPRDIHAIIAQRGFRPATRDDIPIAGDAPAWWDEARLRSECELYTLESDGVVEVLYVSPDWTSAHHLSLG